MFSLFGVEMMAAEKTGRPKEFLAPKDDFIALEMLNRQLSSYSQGVFKFECGADPYGCTTSGVDGQTWTGYRTDLQQSTEQPDVFTVADGDYLFAWGIQLLFVSRVPCISHSAKRDH